MQIEKLMQQLEKVEPGRYCVHPDEFEEIWNASSGPMGAGINCFLYGFLKGQRAERAETKKQAMKEMEKHAQGYGLLVALIEKNMSNERFVQIMTAHASTMDNILHRGEAK